MESDTRRSSRLEILLVTTHNFTLSEAKRVVHGSGDEKINRANSLIELWAQWYAVHGRDDAEFKYERYWQCELSEEKLDVLLTVVKKLDRILEEDHYLEVAVCNTTKETDHDMVPSDEIYSLRI